MLKFGKMNKVLSLFLVLTFLIPTTFVKAEEVENDLIDLTSQEMSESRILSYDEMVEILVEDGYTEEEALEQLGPEFESIDGIQTYSALQSKKYMEFKTRDPIYSQKKSHRIYLVAYCEYTSSGSYGGINTVEHVRIDSGAKSFEGDVYYKLENALRIYFSVSGVLYSSGNVSVNGGGKVEIGEGKTVEFGISRAGTYYDTVSGSTYYKR